MDNRLGALEYTVIDNIGAFKYTMYMDASIKDRITEIITSGPSDRVAWMEARTRNDGVKRRAYIKAKMHMDRFNNDPRDNKWLIMPGLRGIGKTTILTQLYLESEADTRHKFFVSLERIHLVGGTIDDVLSVIEELVGAPLSTVDTPVYVFLDEVQYLENWALGLKTLIDNARKIFIVCTGSSAIALQSNPDVARRSLKMPIHPLCFTEYVLLRKSKSSEGLVFPETGLANDLKRILFDSSSINEVLVGLQSKRQEVTSYWSNFDRQDYLFDYVKFGTLPFTLEEEQDVNRWQRINALLNESLSRDIDSTEKFDSATRSYFPRLLFLLASSDTISVQNIAQTTGLNRRTVNSMIDTLAETEIINPVLPRGSAYRQVSRSTKYLFTSPAMRAAISTSGGALSDSRASHLRGKLIEDVVGMYLKRIFHPNETPAILEYDYSSGGADFIVSRDGQRNNLIPIEVGARKRTADQVKETLERTGGKYGLVVTGTTLGIDSSSNAVFVPFDYFLLV